MTPTHIVTDGPHKGLRCWIYANGGNTVSVQYNREGWKFPIYAVVRSADLRPLVGESAVR